MDYKAQYEGHVEVSVTEDEARLAYRMYAGEMGWSGPFEDHELDAAERAARQNLQSILRVIDTDVVDLEFGACQGVWRTDDG